MNLDLKLKTSRYYNSKRFEMLDFVIGNPKRILEVGCGEGVFSEMLKKKFSAEVWGIELDQKVALTAKNRLDKILCGNAEFLFKDLPHNYFDCIFFNDVLEHLIDPYSVLLKSKSILSRNGVVICSIPNVRYFDNLVKLMIKKQWKYEDEGTLDKTHYRFFTKNSILDMFDELDYEILKIDGIRPINGWKFSLLNVLSLGYLGDTKYLQYACTVKPKKI